MPINLTTTTSNVSVNATTNTITVGSTPSNITISTQSSGVSNVIIRNAFSVNDTGGDGSLSYSSGTGIFTYTGPSASETRAHFSNTSPITYSTSTGVIGIDSGAVFSGKTTDDLAQGTNNIYFSQSGAAVNTTNLPEGTNLYYTDGRFDTRLATKSTTNLAEGTNLYYTDARFNTAFGNKTTTDLPEGTNLYFTDARANAVVATNNTDDISEGSTNLYYTDARSRGAISIGLAGGSGEGELQYNSTTGVFDFYSVQPASIRAMFSGTSPITFNSGSGAIGLDSSTLLNGSTTDDLAEGTTNLYFSTD